MVKGQNNWTISDLDPLSPTFSWYVRETSDAETDVRLISPLLVVTGDNPVLRFWHKYDIFPALNGGFIEISTDGGIKWERVQEKLEVRNSYPGGLSFSAFAIPSLEGFSGSTDGQYIDSYVNLNAYKGQNIKVRFRYGNDGESRSNVTNAGWFIDEIEMLDLVTYQSKACVNSNEDQELRCSAIVETVVNTNSTTSTEEKNFQKSISIYPNPASNSIQISIPLTLDDVQLVVYSLDGKIHHNQGVKIISDKVTLDVSQFIPGMYFLSVVSDDLISTHKIYIQ